MFAYSYINALMF